MKPSTAFTAVAVLWLWVASLPLPAATPDGYPYTRRCSRLFLSDAEFAAELGYSIVDLTAPQAIDRTARSEPAGKYYYLISRDRMTDPIFREHLSSSSAKLVLSSPGEESAVREWISTFAERVRVVLAIPTDAEAVARMYGAHLSGSEREAIVGQFRRVRRTLKPEPRVDVLVMGGSPSWQAAALRELERARADELVVFVGHNEAGRLKFADGSSLELGELVRHAKVQGKTALVISCDTLEHFPRELTGVASQGTLDPDAVALAIRGAGKLLRKRQGLYLGDYLHALESELREAGDPSLARAKWLLRLAAGGTVVVGIPIAMVEEDEKR